MREAGQRVQPNLSRHTVASIVRTFGNDNDTLLAFTVNVPYCISLSLHSWQQPFLYFCKVCCHNTMYTVVSLKEFTMNSDYFIFTLFIDYYTIITESTHWPTLVAGGDCSLQNRFTFLLYLETCHFDFLQYPI